ncbi:MAG: hypothetical protein QM497_01660 [Sulfurimonas sp.]
MQSGLSLKVVSDFDSALYGLPPPSLKRWLSDIHGKKTLHLLYHFLYAPQSWREWQRVASIKYQIQERIPSVKFDEFDYMEGIERSYTISDLGKHFSKFVKYHKPLYPLGKDEFMSNLTKYAMRLYYDNKLFYESVLAMAIHFNTKCKFEYSFRELNSKVKAILKLNRDEWKVKLKKEDLQKAHSKGGLIAVNKKREKFELLKEDGLKLRENGMTLQKIADDLKVSLRTVKSWKLSKV